MDTFFYYSDRVRVLDILDDADSDIEKMTLRIEVRTRLFKRHLHHCPYFVRVDVPFSKPNVSFHVVPLLLRKFLFSSGHSLTRFAD